MSEESSGVTLNGAKWPIAIIVTLFLNFGAMVWGASALTSRVGVVEVDHVEMKQVTTAVQGSVNRQAIDIAEMRVQLDNIDGNVERLLD